jgi:hypothetical protein
MLNVGTAVGVRIGVTTGGFVGFAEGAFDGDCVGALEADKNSKDIPALGRPLGLEDGI